LFVAVAVMGVARVFHWETRYRNRHPHVFRDEDNYRAHPTPWQRLQRKSTEVGSVFLCNLCG
jgi:hypothetical protein